MPRCKPGDLAMITHDVPRCADNIGRIVQVSGPLWFNCEGQLTWIIQPVTPEPYLVHFADSETLRFMDYQEPDIEHPDEWMMPIRPADVDADTDEADEAHLTRPWCATLCAWHTGRESNR